jgi:hypothetical protein
MNENYTTNFTVDQSPKEVYDAINNVRAWWSGSIDGETDTLDSVFDYHFKDIHNCKIKVTELVPGEKVVWHVIDGNLNFVQDKKEWNGTDIVFDISDKDGKTELLFTHVGLKPNQECYNACVDGWRMYINGSLKRLIESGAGAPNEGEALTDSEKTLS